MTLLRHLAIAIIVALVLAGVSIQLGGYRDYQMAEVAAYVTAVAGLTVLLGLSGQISVGNGAFMAVGSYGGALLMLHLNWPLELVFLASHRDRRRGRCGVRYRGGQAARPVPGGGHADAGGRAAHAGRPVHGGVRR